MSRHERAACIGAVLGACLARAWWMSGFTGAVAWAALAGHEPSTARYVQAIALLPLPLVGAILACALVNFAEIHGVARPRRRRSHALPPYPFNPRRTQLVIGETHEQDGSRSERPGWLVLPEKGMYTGLLITGATGSAK